MSSLLSKSDFKVAQTCPTKLYFRKHQYPSTKDDDEYMRLLADGGYMVEHLAKLLHPDGVEIGFEAGPEESFRQTMAALADGNVTLFEATLISDGCIARVDVLEKEGDRLRLIEVKAKSADSSKGRPFIGARKDILQEWRPYLEDIAFQVRIAKRLFPTLKVEGVLRLADKSKRCVAGNIHSNFRLRRSANPNGHSRPEVEFNGNPKLVREDHFLADFDVDQEIQMLAPEIESACQEYTSSLRSGTRIAVRRGAQCAKCEYRLEDDRLPNGFSECWQSSANVAPHILDYYKVGTIGGRGAPLISKLVAEGRAKISDVAESDLCKSGGGVGPDAIRQRLQRQHTLASSEFLSADLLGELDAHVYPLHFIDFETSRVAVPYHAGMRPYEQVAFQWSCHTIEKPDALVTHREWLEVNDVYPNVQFAEALMNALGDRGTIYTWSHHERTTLKDIRAQMELYGSGNIAVRQWIDELTGGGQSRRIVDLCEIAKRCYFHPKMKGRLSLKWVLPAIWGENEALHRLPLFEPYVQRDADGIVVNPYDTLPPLPFPDQDSGEDQDSVVTDGTAAMRAYQDMLYGNSRNNPELRQRWVTLLLQYCKLDTAAMVIVWTHWRMRAQKK